MGLIESHSGHLSDIDGYVQLIPGTYKSERPINITAIDRIRLKCDCINGSIVNGVREPFLYSFVLEKPPGHKIYKEPRIKLFRRINKSVLSYLTFNLEDDDQKRVDFNNKLVSFTCQLVKIYFYNIERT